MKLKFPPLHLKRDTNTGGAEVPLSWNNIRWNAGNLLPASKLEKTQQNNIITGNYVGEGCYLDGRKMMSLCATWWVNVMECA